MRYHPPGYVNTALELIRSAGFRALPVGGCVRDLLRGETPHDWDITTSATPGELLGIFRDFRIAPASRGGMKHGTVTVILGGSPVEITTFRRDGEYSDGRRPDSVGFSRELTDDLSRRDFTINALCIDEQGGIVDLFGGADDLKNRVIRAIGDPDRRFLEDALRIIRALRFAAAFGFEIEQKTAESMLRNAGRIKLLAQERVSAELLKLICAPGFLGVAERYSPLLCLVIPELEPMKGLYQRPDYHCFDVYGHTIHSVAAAPPDPTLRLAMLLHDVGKPSCADGAGHFHRHDAAGAEMAEGILKRLAIGKDRRERIVMLIARHGAPLPDDRLKLKRLLAKYGEEAVLQLWEVKRADTLAKRPDIAAERLPRLERVKALLLDIMAERPALTLRQLAVSGDDLIALGMAPGPRMGALLNELLQAVVAERLPNDRGALLESAKMKLEGGARM